MNKGKGVWMLKGVFVFFLLIFSTSLVSANIIYDNNTANMNLNIASSSACVGVSFFHNYSSSVKLNSVLLVDGSTSTNWYIYNGSVTTPSSNQACSFMNGTLLGNGSFIGLNGIVSSDIILLPNNTYTLGTDGSGASVSWNYSTSGTTPNNGNSGFVTYNRSLSANTFDNLLRAIKGISFNTVIQNNISVSVKDVFTGNDLSGLDLDFSFVNGTSESFNDVSSVFVTPYDDSSPVFNLTISKPENDLVVGSIGGFGSSLGSVIRTFNYTTTSSSLGLNVWNDEEVALAGFSSVFVNDELIWTNFDDFGQGLFNDTIFLNNSVGDVVRVQNEVSGFGNQVNTDYRFFEQSYFSQNITDWDPNINGTSISVGLVQAYAVFSAIDLFNDTVTDFQIFINGDTYNSSDLIPISAGKWNVTFIKSGYYNLTQEIVINALMTNNIEITGVYDALLTLNVKNINDDFINNYSGNITNNISNYFSTFTSNNGSVLIPLLKNNEFSIKLNPIQGYATNINNEFSINTNLTNPTQTLILFEENSIDITFRDDKTKNIINSTNITIDLISDLQSYNFTTTNGTLNLTLLQPETYIMRYSSQGYKESFYIFTLQNLSYNTLNLYLVNESEADIVTVNIIDESTRNIEGALVKLLKYDLETNSYLVTEIRSTDFSGKADFVVRRNQEFYKFIIEIDKEVRRITNPNYIVSEVLTIQILSTTSGLEFFNTERISAFITFNNETNNFRADYNDPSNIGSLYCFELYKTGFNRVLINSTCSNSPSGTLLINHEPSNGFYEGVVYARINPRQFVNSKTFDFSIVFNSGNNGLVLQILLTLFFAFTFMFSPVIGLIVTPLSLLVGRMLELNSLGYEYIVPLIIVSFIIAYLLEGRK